MGAAASAQEPIGVGSRLNTEHLVLGQLIFRGVDITEGVTRDSDVLYEPVSDLDRERNDLGRLELPPG